MIIDTEIPESKFITKNNKKIDTNESDNNESDNEVLVIDTELPIEKYKSLNRKSSYKSDESDNEILIIDTEIPIEKPEYKYESLKKKLSDKSQGSNNSDSYFVINTTIDLDKKTINKESISEEKYNDKEELEIISEKDRYENLRESSIERIIKKEISRDIHKKRKELELQNNSLCESWTTSDNTLSSDEYDYSEYYLSGHIKKDIGKKIRKIVRKYDKKISQKRKEGEYISKDNIRKYYVMCQNRIIDTIYENEAKLIGFKKIYSSLDWITDFKAIKKGYIITLFNFYTRAYLSGVLVDFRRPRRMKLKLNNKDRLPITHYINLKNYAYFYKSTIKTSGYDIEKIIKAFNIDESELYKGYNDEIRIDTIIEFDDNDRDRLETQTTQYMQFFQRDDTP